MNYVRSVFLISVFILTSGCAARMMGGFNNLKVGMTREEALKTAGRPNSVGAEGNVEYLNYKLATSPLDTDGSDTADYFVKLVDDRVVAFGKRVYTARERAE